MLEAKPRQVKRPHIFWITPNVNNTGEMQR